MVKAKIPNILESNLDYFSISIYTALCLKQIIIIKKGISTYFKVTILDSN